MKKICNYVVLTLPPNSVALPPMLGSLVVDCWYLI